MPVFIPPPFLTLCFRVLRSEIQSTDANVRVWDLSSEEKQTKPAFRDISNSKVRTRFFARSRKIVVHLSCTAVATLVHAGQSVACVHCMFASDDLCVFGVSVDLHR